MSMTKRQIKPTKPDDGKPTPLARGNDQSFSLSADKAEHLLASGQGSAPDAGLGRPFERVVEFEPAFDRRDPDPRKSRGVGGVEIRFLLKGELGTVVFRLLTEWMLPNVEEWHDELAQAKPFLLRSHTNATADALIFHGRYAFDGGEHQLDPCPFISGDHTCYVARSGYLFGDEVYQRLKREGGAGLWAALEEFSDQWARRMNTSGVCNADPC